MIQLPNNCRCSEFHVTPENYKSKNAPMDVIWQIDYRFYDSKGKSRYIPFRNKINQLKTWIERKQAVDYLITKEKAKLLNGYNPITARVLQEVKDHYEIEPSTPLIKALQEAQTKLTVAKSTKDEVRKSLVYINQAATKLKLAHLPVEDIKRKHIKKILQLATDGKGTSTFNHYRSYLMMLFKELTELEAVEQNPVRDIEKKKQVKKLRDTLTEDERRAVAEKLAEEIPDFWRFVQIFFHSGARESELMRLKGKDVNLKDQTFKVTVLKGDSPEEVRKVIKTIALPLWAEALKDCGADEYIFSRGLKPGPIPISSSQITRRWNRHVKKKLGITADIYSLKHSNTSEVVDLLSDEDAAKLNSHKGTAMVVGIYDTKREDRQAERLKKINNKFA